MAGRAPRVLVPTDLADALRLLARHLDAWPLAGGTLALNPTQPARPTTLIDLAAIGLDAATFGPDGALHLGGLARIGELGELAALRQPAWGALWDAVDAMEPRVVRAAATVGGNLCSGGTLGGPLVLLGARVRLQSAAGERWGDVCALGLLPGELVTEVVVPPPIRFSRTCAAIVRRTPVGPAQVAVALGERDDGWDVVVSGGHERPVRVAVARRDGDLARAVTAAVPSETADDGAWRAAVAGILARRLAAGTIAPSPRGTTVRRLPAWRPAAVDGEFSFRAEVDDVGVHAVVPAHATLLDALRRAGATQVKAGCGEGACGACSVLVDGCLVRSCLTLATRCGGAVIRTAAAPEHAAVADAIAAGGGLQCGFCTPGIVVTLGSCAWAAPGPREPMQPGDLARELDGNLCRCTGYQQLLAAVTAALAPGGAA